MMRLMEGNMNLTELERDVKDYQQVKDEALDYITEAVLWNETCFERLLEAKKALEDYKKEHKI